MSEQIRKITQEDDKWSVRNTVWDYIEENNLANFPRPVKNRIPNVLDADKAADRVTSLDGFKAARVVKINPDKPQEQARFNTLEANKTLLVPTPRLRQGLFNRIEPPADCNKETLRICATSQGIKEYSKPISLDSKINVDLVIIGSVAVSPKGYRIGKGEGYADLEYAMMRCMDAVTPDTTVVTTVHDCQVFEDLPSDWFGDHDVSVDFIVTPTRVIECKPRLPKPRGIIWSQLTREKLKQVPILKVLRKQQEEAGVDVTLKETQRVSGSEDDAGHSGAEGDHGARRRQPKPRRQRNNLQMPLPGVFVGRFPPSLRASELKSQVRAQDVHPVRMIWRGGKRHAFLLFEKREDAEHALSTLEGMEIDGREVKVEMANERTEREGGDEGGEVRRSPGRGGYSRGRGGRGRGGSRGGGQDRRRRQESSEGDEHDSTPTKGPNNRRLRRRREQRTGPGVFVGSLPKSLKVSEFKQMVRDQNVNPMRVVWRGRNGFSILQFDDQEQADAALNALENFTINDRQLKVLPSTSQPPRGDGDMDGEDGEERPQRRQRRPRGAPRPPRTSGGESGDDSPNQRDQRRRQRPRRKLADTAVLVGNVPKTVRISEFKAKVREQEVNPLRVIWRGNNSHAYLQFETDDQAHEATKLLQGLSIQDADLSVELSNRAPRPGEVEVNGDGTEMNE